MSPTVLFLLLLVIIVVFVVWGVAQYNGLVKARNQVQEAWHQIDVELKSRHDLIPNLVETVKGFAQHERETLEEVLRARTAAIQGDSSPAAAAAQEGQLTQALGRLMAVSEAYPELRSNANFLALQQELSATEDRIASGRRYYNAVVRDLNTKIEAIPTKFFAGPAGVARAEYFETQGNERGVPSVNFGAGGSAGGPAGYTMPEQGSPVEPQSVEYPQIEQQRQAPNPMPQQPQAQPEYRQDGPQGYPGQ